MIQVTFMTNLVRIGMLTGALAIVACDSKTGGDAQHPLIGNPAPELSGKTENHSKSSISLKGMKGKVVIVDFWATFCEPCKKSFPKLQDLYVKYKASGLEILGVSEDEADERGTINAFMDTHGAKFPTLWDEGKKFAGEWKPPNMPSSFVIDKQGVVRFAHLGYHDGEEVELEKEIKELMEK
jgi:peroxiredoxin